ncbi:hypothetical protein MNBD_GAMMA10-1743, partial [hydrothermal vent metagenome]
AQADSVEGLAGGSNKKALRQQQAEQRKLLNPLKKEVKKLEQTMQELEQSITQLEQALSEPAIYQAQNREQMEVLTRQRSDVSKQLGEVEEAWLTKSEALETLSSQVL